MNISKQLKMGFTVSLVALALSGCNLTKEQSQDASPNTALASANPLTLDRIITKREFSSDYIGRIRWLADGSGYTAVEKSEATTKNKDGKEVSLGRDIVFYNPETLDKKVLVSAKQLIPEGKEKPLPIHNYIWSEDKSKLLIYTNSKRVWRSNSRGDYWVLDLKTSELKQLGGDIDESTMMFAKFSSDGSKIGYVHKDNIYVQHLNDMSIEQLTFDTEKHIINGNFDWVYEEEFIIRDGFRWSPDGTKIAYWQLDTSGSKDFIMINNTDSLYPTITKFPYPKVGETNAAARIGVVSLKDKKTTWAKLPGNARDMYVPRMDWAGNSEDVLIHHVNRKQDTNTLYYANAKTGNLDKVLVEQEETFLDFYNDAKYIDDGKAFIWHSERSGWRHLYRVSRDGKEIVNLTPGEFDITEFKAVDEKNGWIYFIASPDNVTQRYLYRTNLDGSGNMTRVTPKEYAGSNSYQMSADGSWAIHTHSSWDKPSQKRLVNVAKHETKHLLMDNKALSDKLAKETLGKTEFFQVNARDGIVLDGYIVRPPNFDPKKKYPIVFYVYGEAVGQTVNDRFSSRTYMWSQMMAQKGYLVASIDNRGTAVPKGRDWRKSMYGAVGVLSSRDQFDALQAMAKRWSYIDTDRVGIWGHSGGGSMTLNMLFRYPEHYHVGVSLAPVPDQRLYDTIYQERYSGLLEDYAEGYKEGSPITHAKNLEGKLLLVHGTGDDNVHYQGTEMLINELVKHNKQFDFMSYPNRSHGIYEGAGTTLHLRTMLTNYFDTHLMNK